MAEGLFPLMFRPVDVQWLQTDAKLSNGTLYKLTTTWVIEPIWTIKIPGDE